MNGDHDKTDPFAEWIMAHPWTMCYVAIVVTLLLILNVVQVLTQ